MPKKATPKATQGNVRAAKPSHPRLKSLNKENMADEWLDSPRQKSGATNSSRTTSKVLDDAQEEALICWIKRVKEMSHIPNVLQVKSASHLMPGISKAAVDLSSKDYPRT
ncbi:unnamed protein product [Penicillium pancosmium]